MKKGPIITMIVILSILVVILVGMLVTFMVTRNNIRGGNFMGFFNHEPLSVRKEEEIDVSTIKNLNFNFISSDANFYTTTEDKVKVVQKATSALDDDELFTVTKTSDSIQINERDNNIWNFFSFRFISIKFDIYIPESYVQNISAGGASSDFRLNDSMTLNNLDLHTTSGEVEILAALQATNFKLSSVSGNVEATDISGDTGTINTTSGEIRADRIRCQKSIDMKSISGNISAGVLEGAATAKSTSGNVDVLEFNITGNSKMESVSGNINVGLKEGVNCNISNSTVSGNSKINDSTRGTSPYHTLLLKTVSGNITVR